MGKEKDIINFLKEEEMYEEAHYFIMNLLNRSAPLSSSEILKEFEKEFGHGKVVELRFRRYLGANFINLLNLPIFIFDGNEIDYESKVEKLGFNNRINYLLKLNGVENIKDFKRISVKKFRDIRGIGGVTYARFLSDIKRSPYSINQNVYSEEPLYKLFEFQGAGLESTDGYVEKFFDTDNEKLNISMEEIYEKITSLFYLSEYDIEEMITLVFLVNLEGATKSEVKQKYTKTYMKDSIFEEFILELELRLENISDFYHNMSLESLNLTDFERLILYTNEIEKIKDLKKLPIEVIFIIFSYRIKEVLSSLSCMEISNIFEKELERIEEALNKDEQFVLSKRFGFKNSKRLTLEEVGTNFLGVTRERVRQIEKKGISKLEKTIDPNFMRLLFDNISNKRKYILVDEFNNFINYKILADYYLVYLESKDISIKYEYAYGLLYNKEQTSFAEIENKTLNSLSSILVDFNIESQNSLIQILILENYKKYNSRVYIRKELSRRDLIVDIIETIYPTGFRISDDEQFNHIKKTYKEKYYDSYFPQPHALGTMIVRAGFVLSDRGTYISAKYKVEIPEDLLIEIQRFIFNNGPAVHYSTIFTRFKKELKEIGIDNHYYLKGCLDKELDPEIQTRRDYLTLDNETSGYDMILNKIRSFKGEFYLKDLRKEFPGLNDIVFYNIIYSEIEKDLIHFNYGGYMYFDKFNLTEETINEFKKYLYSMFETLNSNVLSAMKIYAHLSFIHPSLFEKLKVNSSYGLFYLIKYLFPEFYYSRPLISKVKNKKLSSYYLTKSHAEKLDVFTTADIQEYIDTLNLEAIMSFTDFFEDLSETHVMVDLGKLIRKELADISISDINKIKDRLNLITQHLKKINTETFKGYALFPEVNFEWNKYLLAGIIRTYLPDEFEVYNTNNNYTLTEYIIRRKNGI